MIRLALIALLLTGCATYSNEWEHEPIAGCYDMDRITLQVGEYPCPEADMIAPMPSGPNDHRALAKAGARLLALRHKAEHGTAYDGEFEQWDWGGLRLRMASPEEVSSRAAVVGMPSGMQIEGRFYPGRPGSSPIIVSIRSPYTVGHELHHALLYHMSPATGGEWHGPTWMER